MLSKVKSVLFWLSR